VISATLRVTHKAMGAEVRRDAYEGAVDGAPVGSVEMNDVLEVPLEPGRHTAEVRSRRVSSR